MPRTPFLGFPSAISALLPVNLSPNAYIRLKAREEAHGFSSVIKSSGMPSRMIAGRLRQENLLRDNPQVPGPQGHHLPGRVSWLTPTLPLLEVAELFLIFMDPYSAAIHARMMHNEGSVFCVCGCPSHGYYFLVVHLGLSLPYSNLHFLWWWNPQGTCYVKDSLAL